jgi:hypothetical protein
MEMKILPFFCAKCLVMLVPIPGLTLLEKERALRNWVSSLLGNEKVLK